MKIYHLSYPFISYWWGVSCRTKLNQSILSSAQVPYPWGLHHRWESPVRVAFCQDFSAQVGWDGTNQSEKKTDGNTRSETNKHWNTQGEAMENSWQSRVTPLWPWPFVGHFQSYWAGAAAHGWTEASGGRAGRLNGWTTSSNPSFGEETWVFLVPAGGPTTFWDEFTYWYTYPNFGYHYFIMKIWVPIWNLGTITIW